MLESNRISELTSSEILTVGGMYGGVFLNLFYGEGGARQVCELIKANPKYIEYCIACFRQGWDEVVEHWLERGFSTGFEFGCMAAMAVFLW